MRKRVLCVLLLSLVCFAASASSVRYVFGDMSQHPEITGGFAPTYLLNGVGFTGLSFLEGNTTEFQVLLGGGYQQRKLWQNADGSVLANDPLIYDVGIFDWVLRIEQGFGDSWVPGKDLFTLSLGYEGKFEKALDSMKEGSYRDNGGQNNVIKTIDAWVANHGDISTVYPDLKGDRTYLGNAFTASLRLNLMQDVMSQTDGVSVRLEGRYAPGFLNGILDGEADFYSVGANVVMAKTLFHYTEKKKDLFSIIAIDRANVTYLDGDKVPAYAQLPASLGRKVRGFSKWTDNTQLTFVNNFDIRFTGPDMGIHGLFPRVCLFFDIGYAMGKYANTDIDSDGHLLMSTGIQAHVSLFDFISFGYQVAYLIKGDNLEEGTDKKVVGKFTFFLDF